MNKFPQELNSKNKEGFPTLNYNIKLCLLRSLIFKHILSNTENDFFDLNNFSKEHLKNNKNMLKNLTEIIIKELEALDWNCKTSFGGTGLFIYSTENPPPSCFEDKL